LKPTTASWRVDETYIKVKKAWMYLYRAVDSEGKTLDFWLSPTRDAEAAKRFFLKTLAASHTSSPRVINVDKHAAYPMSTALIAPDPEDPTSTILELDERMARLCSKKPTAPGFGSHSAATHGKCHRCGWRSE